MHPAFAPTTLGQSGLTVSRLTLSATYRPSQRAILLAAERGINSFFLFGIDGQMKAALRTLLGRDREQKIAITGAYNLIWGHTDIRRTLEKRLRQLRTDYIDVFLLLGVTKPAEFPDKVKDELNQLLVEQKVRTVGLSTHDRKFAGRLAAEGTVGTLMIRYNAAHRGAETDIFPFTAEHDPGVIAYTATRWSYLVRRPNKRLWPKTDPIPTAAQAYRFVLSNPSVHTCLTAPRSARELEQNLAVLDQGPLDPDEMQLLRQFGDVVHHTKKWFM